MSKDLDDMRDLFFGDVSRKADIETIDEILGDELVDIKRVCKLSCPSKSGEQYGWCYGQNHNNFGLDAKNGYCNDQHILRFGYFLSSNNIKKYHVFCIRCGGQFSLLLPFTLIPEYARGEDRNFSELHKNASLIQSKMICRENTSWSKRDEARTGIYSKWRAEYEAEQKTKVKQVEWDWDNPIAKPIVRDWHREFVQASTEQAWRDLYSAYLESPQWTEKRRQVSERDGGCKTCNGGDYLVTHHLNYSTVGDEDIKHLITLCNRCHKIYHTIKKLSDNVK